MNLGVFLAIGESLADFDKKGQLKRLVNYNFLSYAKSFDKVYVFSYANEKKFRLPKNCYLVANTSGLGRYLYAVFLPFIKSAQIRDCQILRGLQLTGGIPAVIAKIIYGKKFVINYGYDYSQFAKIEKKFLQSLLYKLIKGPILKLADKIIVTSLEIKNQLSGPKSKISYIPNGVDLKMFHPKKSLKSKKGLDIIYLGRLEKQKNLESAIMAAALLPNLRIKLKFIGNGSQTKKLKKVAQNLKVQLEIKPSVDYLNVPNVLSSADIFILPSLEEGSPKILLEAMASAIPPIGTNVRGIRELIEDGKTGILCQPDHQSIARAIKRLSNRNLREKIGKNAQNFVAKNYDIYDLLKKEVGLLKSLV